MEYEVLVIPDEPRTPLFLFSNDKDWSISLGVNSPSLPYPKTPIKVSIPLENEESDESKKLYLIAKSKIEALESKHYEKI